MALKEDWKEAGGFNDPRSAEKPAGYQIRWTRFYLFLKVLVALVLAVALEFFLCGAFFRFLRPADAWRVDGACALASPLLCYWYFRKPLQAARRENVPFYAAALFLAALSLLLGCFLRYSLQLANGLLDFSDPETRVILVLDRKTSAFGGSLREGPNPEAHLVYFRDWDNPEVKGEILVPSPLYYLADLGTPLSLTYRKGFFHWPWMVDVQPLGPH